MIRDILKNKLKSLGYSDEDLEKHLDEVNYGLLTTRNDLKEEDIEVITYSSPDANIERALLDVDSNYLSSTLIDGEIEAKSVQLPTGGRLAVMDYALDKNLCMVLITSDLKIEIMFYSPENSIVLRYKEQKYDEIYSKDRNAIIQDYLDEFVSSNRLMQNKAREVLDMLANDFVIDEMVIRNVIPVLKLYNTPDNFAEKITSYEFKYINRRINRIEIAEKTALVKRTSKNVKTGYLSNDPYTKLNEVNSYADFYLNTVAYFWLFSNEKGQEEIGIYTAPRVDNILYSKTLVETDMGFSIKAREIAAQFTNQLGFLVSEDAIKEILYKLNHQLVVPPVNVILKYAENPSDPIEPLSYRYRAIVDATEFENRLYNSIEDNMGRRYKYKLTENVLEDLTTIGNKLDYTTSDGKSIKKQSIADFNQNGNAVIIRRETLIDESNIPDLLGYIYDDIENNGTARLPVPSIEVDFFFPSNVFGEDGVKMYNGTNYESMAGNVLTGNNFYAIDNVQNIYTNQAALEGSTKVTIRYLANNGDLLRENSIRNVFPGDTYVPEILPIISDKDGKEWVYKNTAIPKIVLSDKEENNVIELLYIEKMAEVVISFVNTEGVELSHSQRLEMQVGAELNSYKYLTVNDSEGIEWDLVDSKPKKLTVNEDASQNKIRFIYDVTRVNVLVNYINKNGTKLKESVTVSAIANKKYLAKIDPIIEDESGKSWVYISEAAASIVPLENTENVVNLVYDEMKAKVLTTFEDENGNKVIDDVINFVQVGKQYSANYEDRILDNSHKVWGFSSVSKQILKVSTDENENRINVIYTPVYSKVTIKYNNENGKAILKDTVEDMQVGSSYTAKNRERIKDGNGKVWHCKEQVTVEISENAQNNIIALTYEPWMVNAVVRYFDDESREIIPSKIVNIQAGELYVAEIPTKLEDKVGRKWKAAESNEKEYLIKEHEEENKITIYYEKELTEVVLSFKDLYSKTLLDDVTVQWQIGAEYNDTAYEKIKDKSGARWSRVSSEPKTIIVKEKNNKFTLIYDEIRTKVILRYINIIDNTPIKEPDIITAKLGVSYIPNIQHEFIDPDRLNWIYAGEKELSIITQEEEQDNIIVLKYEPHNAKVTVKYLDESGKNIIADNVKEMQVGREVQIKKLEKIYSENKMGYELKSITHTVIRVNEDENKNIITCVYVPWLTKIITVYRNKDGIDLIKPLHKELQVGSVFNAEIIDKVIDNDGKYWNYSGENVASVKVTEEDQTLNLHYEPELREVRVKFINAETSEIIPAATEQIQVGEKYIPKIDETVSDIDGKVWIFDSINKKEFVVAEDELQNEAIIKYNKKLVAASIDFVNDSEQQIRATDKIMVQLGSILVYEAAENIIDKDGLGWEISTKGNNFKIKESDNNFVISYVPYLVNVYDKFVNENNEDIVRAAVTKKQVGTKYEPEIKDVLIDDEGKEWLHVDENKLFGKALSIKVSVDETKNEVKIKYKPSLTDVTVLYVDPLGRNIKQNTVVKAQIGSQFSADVIERITDASGNKWTYNPNTKNQVKVDRTGTEIILSYEEQKAVVIYKYQDEYGNRLKTSKKLLAQVGMNYTPEVDPIVEDDQGKVWEYKERDLESIEIKDTEQDNVFVMIYAPLKVDVVLFIKDTIGNKIISPMIVKAQLGADYSPNIENSITDENSLMYRFKQIQPQSIKVKENPIGSEENINAFTLTYESVYSMVTVRFQDIDGNILRDEEKMQLQVGTVFEPKKSQFIKDRKENQWQLVTTEDVSIRVKENEKENIIKIVYEIAMADVIIRYKDTEGNALKDDERITLQIGNEYVPNPPKYLLDNDNKKWSFFSCEPVKLRVGSIDNIVTISYQEEKAAVLVKYVDTSGRQLKTDDRVLVQIGSQFKPKVSSKVIYDENEIWRFIHFDPKEITVSENTKENVIFQVYTNKEIDTTLETAQEESDNEKTIVSEEVSAITGQEAVDLSDVKNGADISLSPEEMQKDKGYVYNNPKLKALENVTLLNDNEKRAIEKINEINDEIIKALQDVPNNAEVSSSIENMFEQEKEIVSNNLNEIIESDKTGSKLLKIFEIALQQPEEGGTFDVLQQRKAVAMTDYFLNKQLSDSEQAIYICSKGKNDKQIEILRNINVTTPEMKAALAQVVYERLLLENYYRARSAIKDNYFIDETSKNQMSQEINTAVSNMLVNQTYNLMIKANVNSYQQVEMMALSRLLNQMQKDNLTQKINKIADSKQRKNLLKKLQEL